MRLFVKVGARSKHPGLEVIDEDHFVVRVKEPPVDNKANFAVLEMIAHHFSVSLGQVRLVSGRDSTQKVVEVVEIEK